MKIPSSLQILYRRLLSNQYYDIEITQTNDLINIKGGFKYDGKDFLSSVTFKITHEGLEWINTKSGPVDGYIWKQ